MKINALDTNSKYTYPFIENNFQFAADTHEVMSWENISPAGHHSHPNAIELQYIHSGTGFYFIKNRRYAFHGKTMLVIHGGDIHSYAGKENSSPMKKTTIIFSDTIFKKFTPLHPMLKKISSCRKTFPHMICFDEKEATLIEFTINLFLSEMGNAKPFNKIVILNAFALLLTTVARNISSPKRRPAGSGGKKHPLVERVLKYIDVNFRKPIVLSELSKSVCYSPFHVSHVFNKFTGMSIRKTLSSRRVVEAKHLLNLNDGKKIIDIAYESGFSDLSSFNREFRQLTGQSPSKYRNICISFSK